MLSNSSSDDEGALGQGAAAARRPGAPTWGSRAGKVRTCTPARLHDT